MKLIFDKQALLEALTPAMTTVSNKNTISSLEGILFECEKGNKIVRLSSYDMKKGVISEVEAESVEEEGSHIIPAHRLQQILRLMPNGRVTIDVDSSQKATISSLSGHFSLKAQSGTEFPSLPELNIEKSFSIKSRLLKRVIGKVLHSIAEQDVKAMLCGAFFLVEEDGLEVVSCNNFMLSRCHIKCPVGDVKNENGDPLSFIVPGHALQELIKLLEDKEEDIIISLARKHVMFKKENLLFFTRLIEEKYMDYRRIIPTGMPISVKIAREHLLEGIERVNLIAEEKAQANTRSFVKIDLEGSLFKMTAVSASGNAYEEIACEHDGDDLQIGFNGRFLLSCIRAIESEELLLTMKSATQSMTIEPAVKKEEEESSCSEVEWLHSFILSFGVY